MVNIMLTWIIGGVLYISGMLFSYYIYAPAIRNTDEIDADDKNIATLVATFNWPMTFYRWKLVPIKVSRRKWIYKLAQR